VYGAFYWIGDTDMATTIICTENARVVAHAYGNYRCDLAAIDFDQPHSVKVFIASADKLIEVQKANDFYILDEFEIECIKDWANGNLDD
jgi:hypothetical protein